MLTKLPWRKTLASLILLLLLDFILYCGYLVHQQEQDLRTLKLDMAELTHIKYGMLSVDEWEKKLTLIVEKKIEQYELSDESREGMRERVRALILQMIDITSEVIRDNHQEEGGLTGWFKGRMFNILVNVDELKEDAPRIAESFISFIDKPENREKIQLFIAEQIQIYAGETVGETDYRHYDEVVSRYGADDGVSAREHIAQEIDNISFSVNSLALLMLVASIPLVLAAFSRSLDRGFPISLLLILALVTLYLGIAVPMIDIDARVGTLSFQLVGELITFNDQVLFFQSKSILEVVQIMLSGSDLKLAFVGGLVLLFSVLFPLTKVLISSSWISRPAMRQRSHPLVCFFVFKSGKWSMADVMVVAIFMAYLGFAGVMDSQLKQLDRSQGNLQVLTTSSSELQIGFYFFTFFCILGLFISQMTRLLGKSR